MSMSNVQATLADLGLADSTTGALTVSIIAETEDASTEASRKALDELKSAVTKLNRSRGSLGAVQSRLQSIVDNLLVARESFKSTESSIMDADIAEESAELAKVSVRQQAGTALLAQANLQPRTVLELLRD
jgi:flagellin